MGKSIQPLSPTNTGGYIGAIVSTLAGAHKSGFQDGNGTNAKFDFLTGITTDDKGNLFVSDGGNNRIRKISPTGFVTTIAGNGKAAYADGIDTLASFSGPNGLIIDKTGNLFVAESGNNRVRKISPNGIVTTLAGNSCTSIDNFGYKHGCFAEGIGTAASFDGPNNIAADDSGYLYVTDSRNNRIRKISPSGAVSTFVGNSCTTVDSLGHVSGCFANGNDTAASFNLPVGISRDRAGNFYIGDALNKRIRKITPAGLVSTLAGSGNGYYKNGYDTLAEFFAPFGTVVDKEGIVYVADYANNTIRKITPSGYASTYAGGVTGSSAYIDGIDSLARFNSPTDLTVDSAGNVYVADFGNYCVRKISPLGKFSISPKLPMGLFLDPASGVITGTPTAPSPSTNYIVTAINASGSSSFTLNIAVQWPLPLVLINFTAIPKEKSIVLRWKSGNENNSGYFVIERSPNGREFSAIGNTTAKGTAFAEYTFQDPFPCNGNNYYRLKMIDKEGSSAYSSTVTVPFAVNHYSPLTVSPNPSNGSIVVNTNLSSECFSTLSLIDLDGKVVFEKSLFLPKGAGHTKLDLNGKNILPKGIYYLRAIGTRINVQKVVIE